MSQHRPYGALVALLVLAGAVQARAQTSHEEAVYLLPEVRAQLKAAWDTVHAAQPERAYCLVTERALRPDGSPVEVVTRALRAVAWDDDAYQVNFDCGKGKTWLHTHPPATCTPGADRRPIWATCHLGGPDAYDCAPSETDQTEVELAHVPFGIIQCDEEAFTVVYPRKAVATGKP